MTTIIFMLLCMVAGGSGSYGSSFLKLSLLKFREFICIGPIVVAIIHNEYKESSQF